jgi:hypothetical protein
MIGVGASARDLGHHQHHRREARRRVDPLGADHHHAAGTYTEGTIATTAITDEARSPST